MEDTQKIRRVWQNVVLKKIFIDILTNTQLHRCKHVRHQLVRAMNVILCDKTLTDEQIYAKMFHFVHVELDESIRQRIQHKETYRAQNRASKLSNFIKMFGNGMKPTAVLDIGCDDGAITTAVGQLLGIPPHSMHGSDVIPAAAPTSDARPATFTYHHVTKHAESLGTLPFGDGTLDVVYAFMSLHHIQNANVTIAEVYRVLKPSGLFIIREHDCVDLNGYRDVLDVVHGFYCMVWANPTEKASFKDEHWACYFGAGELQQKILGVGFKVLLNTNKNDKNFPTYIKGKVINPLRYYYAVYKK